MKPQRREQLAIIALDAKHHFHHPFGQPPVQVAVDQRFEVERLASPGPVAHTRPEERADRRPHTSNWDLPMTLMVAFALELRPRWMGKASIFRWPFAMRLSRYN